MSRESQLPPAAGTGSAVPPPVFDAALLAQRDFWLARLAGLGPEAGGRLPELTAGEASSGRGRCAGSPWTLRLDLAPAALGGLERLADGSPLLLYTLLLGALKVCLFRYGSRGAIAVGSPALATLSRRPGRRNGLPVVSEVSGGMSFTALLTAERQALVAAYAHQDYPIDRLRRDLARGRPGGLGAPLFSCALALAGLHGDMPDCGQALTATFTAAPGALTASFTARNGLARWNVAQLAGHLAAVLAQAAAEPARPVGSFRLPGDAERHLLLRELNATPPRGTAGRPAAAAGGGRLVHELVAEQARRSPAAAALTGSGVRLSYGELDTAANRLAHRLRGLGVGPEERVVVLMERAPEMVVALLAVWKAGGAYVPVDPAAPRERLRLLLADCGARVVLTQRRLLARIPSSAATVLPADGDTPAYEDGGTAPPAGATGPGLAYILYTSGSTGRPKGVMVSHHAAAAYVAWAAAAYQVAEGRGCPVASPIGFDLTVTALFTPLVRGRRVDLLPEGPPVESLAAALAAADGYSLVKITPAHLEALGHWLPAAAAAGATRAFIIGGEALRAEQLAFWRRHAPATRLINEYGPTETVVGCCIHELPLTAAPSGAVPIGRPAPHAALYVLDAELEPTPLGVPGELAIGGEGVARGYLGRPGLTADRFIPDPFGDRPGARLYRTGDIVRWGADGDLLYLGRRDRQVKLRGHRVELGEIEALLGEHPRVAAAAVVVRETEPGAPRLAACVVPRDGVEPAGWDLAAELRPFLAARLPAPLVPWEWVPLARLPLSPNGKVDHAALAAAPVAGASPEAAAEGGRTGGGRELARRGPLAELVAAAWEEVLGRTAIHWGDHFFALGGHSLAATRVAVRVRDALGIEVAPNLLFEAPVFAAYCLRVEEIAAARSAVPAAAADPDGAPIPRRPPGAPPVMSLAQEQLWFVEQLKPGTAAFNIPAGLAVKGRLNAAALDAALRQLLARHEALRTVFPVAGGSPSPRLLPAPEAVLATVDLQRLPPGRRQEESRRLRAVAAGRPFDLARGPLLRAWRLGLAAEDHLVLLVVHHVAADGWSMAVLIEELAALYRRAGEANAPPLPALPVQYGDYADWQRRRLDGQAVERHLAGWRRRLAGVPAPAAFATDRPRWTHGLAGAMCAVELPAELADALRVLGRGEGATLFMVLLAGFALLLRQSAGGGSPGAAGPARRGGPDDLVVGTDAANRGRAEVEGLIGLFVHQLPLRLDLGGDPDFITLLRRTREVTLEAYARQELPFGTLVDALKLPRTLASPPLFTTKLLLQSYPLRELALPGLSLRPEPLDNGTAQLDLVLAFAPGEAGLRGWVNYRTGLFDEATIVRLLDGYRALLAAAAAAPGLHASQLTSGPLPPAGRSHLMQDPAPSLTPPGRFKSIKARPVALPAVDELVEEGLLAPDRMLPLLLRPRLPDLDPAAWAAARRPHLERLLALHGGLLFRGFRIESAGDFERFAAALTDELFQENGEHPRQSVSGNVYTPVFYPPDQQLLWHNENSFNLRWPRKILFCCMRPAETGGETPIVDSRQVFSHLEPALREPFERLGVMYVRNFVQGLGRSWRDLFGCDSREAVEASCRADRTTVEWGAGDRLRTRAVRPAVIDHPLTDERSWFNQAQHWHTSCLDGETRRSLGALFAPDDLPRQCFYGDGGAIDDAVMQRILAVYAELEISFPWQRSDVLLLDNILTAHGRKPFTGRREILVALGDMDSAAAPIGGRAMNDAAIKQPAGKRFQAATPRPVRLPQDQLVEMLPLRPGERLPLLIRPVVEDIDPVEWARQNRELIRAQLLAHGGILFRGFDVSSPERFERTIQAVTPDLAEDNGELPRSNISEKIYAVSYAPPEQRILWHNENSFCPSWPMKLWFCCVQPAERGGETPIADNREVLARLDPQVRDAFRDKGIMYLRNFGRGLDFSWQTAFRTDDRAEVERRCREGGIDFEWRGDDGLRTRSVRPAVLRHPRTGEEVFFAQPALWHTACNPPEMRKAKLAFFREEDFTRHCYYGDGSRIDDAVMQRICDAYSAAEVAFPWQKGDFMLLDNMLTAHARNAFAGPRVIYAAVAEVVSAV